MHPVNRCLFAFMNRCLAKSWDFWNQRQCFITTFQRFTEITKFRALALSARLYSISVEPRVVRRHSSGHQLIRLAVQGCRLGERGKGFYSTVRKSSWQRAPVRRALITTDMNIALQLSASKRPHVTKKMTAHTSTLQHFPRSQDPTATLTTTKLLKHDHTQDYRSVRHES